LSGGSLPGPRPDLGAALRNAAARTRPQATATPASTVAEPRPAISGRSDQHRSASERRRRPEGRVLGWLLLAIVVLAPLPVGSNRPAAWMLWSAVLYAAAAFRVWRKAWAPGEALLRARRLWPLVLPPVVLLAWGVVQILPLGGVLGSYAPLPDTGAPTPRSISLAPDASRLALLRMGGSLVFFVLMLEAAARLSRARRLATAIFIGSVLYAIWGMVALKLLGDVHFWGPKQSYAGVATGPFINRNSFATFLGIGAVLGLATVLEEIRRPRMRRAAGGALTDPETLGQALHWAGLGLVLLCLVMTQSRMGLFATSLALILVVAISPLAPLLPNGRRPRNKWLIGLGLAAMTGIALYASSGVIERMLFVARASANRIEMYRQSLDMILARPLTGYGADSFALGFELFHRPALAPHLTFELPHSSYLTLWTDFGLVFGSLLIVSGTAAVWKLVLLLRDRRADVALPVAALASTVLVAVHSLVDFSLEMQANLFLYLAVLALGLARDGRSSYRSRPSVLPPAAP
jgi:O-antigen ligase